MGWRARRGLHIVGVASEMRIPFPTSRGAFRFRFCLFDLAWALVSPMLALYLSDAYVLSYNGDAQTVVLYGLVSASFAAICFLFFRIEDGILQYFSVHDALDVAKAVVTSELLTCVVLFSLTRLEGIPRSTPIIHALILAAGLLAFRTFTRILANNFDQTKREGGVTEHVILIGSNRLSSLYIKLLQVCAPQQQRVVAVLDGRSKMMGRTIERVRIVGAPQHLDAIIDEYAVHGIGVDRVIVGGDFDTLTDVEMKEVRRVCARREIALDFVTHLLGMDKLKAIPKVVTPKFQDTSSIAPPVYFRWKYIFDFCAALTLIIALLPLMIGVCVIVFLDVGSPVLFWQQRLGVGGRKFLLYKFRTLSAPFDWRGEPLPPSQRLSRIGHLLRDTSLDELPQLLNVLVGDMSLIGPRPLLPEDQPNDSAERLLVRPGITGWAQVNGGKLVTVDDKKQLDGWYIRNASMWLDLRIVLRTLRIVLVGAGRSNEAVVGARKAPVASPQMRDILEVAKAEKVSRVRS
jgi:lipopolysaccharide/colanic/teichoic acid biosynthesis glycosyltransferase